MGLWSCGGRLRCALSVAAALVPLPPARATEEPAGPERSAGGGVRLPPCLSPGRGGPAAGSGAAGAAELPWPPLCGESLRRPRRGPGFPARPLTPLCSLTLPPAARRGLGELSRGLAWQLGGPGPAGQRQEEPGAQPCPPAGRQRLLEREGAGQPPPGQPGGTGLRFGLVPAELHASLLDREDYRKRTQAVEALKRVVGGASEAAVSSTPAPSLLGLIELLCTLLDDSNFKVVLGALEVTHLLALCLGGRVQPFLASLTSAAAKVLGDNKPPVRQQYTGLFQQLMKAAGPQQVLDLLLTQEHLQHKNSRVREEVVNICILALLTYPSEELDLAKLAFGLAPALVDSKRRVRHAAMEAFAALASSMGPGKTALLFKAVDAVELEDKGDGLMHAVQARLARKLLPKVGDQGFVEYAVPLLSSGCHRGSCFPPGADTEWLLMGSRTQSAYSYCGCHARDGALPNSRSHGVYGEQGASPRKALSAVKGKNKLPWENECTGDKEGGSGVKMPFTTGVEQFSTANVHSPNLTPSQGVPVIDELFFSRKKSPRSLFQNSVNLTSEHSSVCAGAMGSHRPQISGKCGTLGYTQTHGKSGSVDSDLQFLGLNNCHQDKGTWILTVPNDNKNGRCTFSETKYIFKHIIVKGVFRCDIETRHRAYSGECCVPATPANGCHLLVSSSGENLQEKQAPLQLKPTLVRFPTSRRGLNRTRPVPPIPRLTSPLPDKMELNGTKWRNEEGVDTLVNDRKLAADLSELNVDGEEVDQEEMQNALRSLRNSAAKKKAKLCSGISDLQSPHAALKLDLSAESPSHASSPSAGSGSKSGVYSPGSLTSPVATVPQRRRITSDTFPILGNKSQPARVPLARNRDPNVAERSSSTGISLGMLIYTLLHWCNGMVTGCVLTCSMSSCPLKTGLPESSSSFPRPNNVDSVSPSVLSEDAIVIVGKGVLGGPPSAPTCGQSTTCVANGGDHAVREETEPSSGICGRSIKQNSAYHLHVENEKGIKVTMSKSAQDKIRRKKKEEKEQNHKEYQEAKDLEEKEENSWESFKLNESEKVRREKLNLCGEVLPLSRTVPLPLEHVALSPSLKRTSSLKKTTYSASRDPDGISLGAHRCCRDPTLSVTHGPETTDPRELQLLAKPEAALTEALTLLAGGDWEKKIQGLNFVRRLSANHATVLTAKLHETSLAVAEEVKNLRSGVSRAAVVCLGDLFTYLKKSMDEELDNTVKVLLQKACESNTFIREEVDKALKAMVNNVTPARALCSLINGGQSHLNSVVRRCTAQHLSDVVECMGPERILSGGKAVADRLFPAVARFAQDSSQQTRYYGRKMLFSMMTHPRFDRTLEKYVPAKDLPYLKESVTNLREKGLSDMPLDAPSAKGKRSHTVGHSKSSSASRGALKVTGR
ncbi:TOG array regulator of axonemal microtubules protein 1 [Pterocles gutturalis]